MQYCEHASLNAVLVYYCDWVRHLGADVDVKAAVPQYININNAELCSMVGNLLENATEAITQQTQGERRLKVRIRYRSGPPAALFITVDNTYGEADTSIEQIDGDLVSTKHGGTGLGTATVRETAERHHGLLRAQRRHVPRLRHAVSRRLIAYAVAMRYDGQAASRAAFVG